MEKRCVGMLPSPWRNSCATDDRIPQTVVGRKAGRGFRPHARSAGLSWSSLALQEVHRRRKRGAFPTHLFLRANYEASGVCGGADSTTITTSLSYRSPPERIKRLVMSSQI